MPHALPEVKAEKYDESPAKITVKIGDNIIIPCLMEYRLTYFAWKLCHSNCKSSDAKWKPVIARGNGFTSLCDPEKYGLGLNGSLVVKNIQPWDNENWLRCFYKEPFVRTYHRTSIIVIKQGCESGVPFLIPVESMTASSQNEQYPADHGVFRRVCHSQSHSNLFWPILSNLDRCNGDSFWCSEEEKTSYIEIRFPMKYKITGARLQLKRKYKIKNIILKVQLFDQWINLHHVKPPYSTTVKQIKPAKPFVAQSLRIRVLRKRSMESICLNVGVLGCEVPKGCILEGSAVLIKRDGGYRKGYVGGIFYGRLEIFQFGERKSTLKKAADVILDEKANVHELTKGTLVLADDVYSPGVIREGIIEQIWASSCTIKTNNETWKSNLNGVRIVKISNLCPS